MEREEVFEFIAEQEHTFHVRQMKMDVMLNYGILMNPDRLRIGVIELEDGPYQIIRGLLDIATQEEKVFEYPNNFLTRLGQDWHELKERWMPKWLRRRLPIKRIQVDAIHKFPELNIPNDLVGKEFVKFRVVDMDKLRKKMEDSK